MEKIVENNGTVSQSIKRIQFCLNEKQVEATTPVNSIVLSFKAILIAFLLNGCWAVLAIVAFSRWILQKLLRSLV
jgi:flagellar biogenesis protein FliO